MENLIEKIKINITEDIALALFCKEILEENNFNQELALKQMDNYLTSIKFGIYKNSEFLESIKNKEELAESVDNFLFKLFQKMKDYIRTMSNIHKKTTKKVKKKEGYFDNAIDSALAESDREEFKEIIEKAKELADLVYQKCPENPERTFFIRRLQESLFWSVFSHRNEEKK